MTQRDAFEADAVAWELELERFASGEMNHGEENALLARCEIEPARWRDVALACVEYRRLVADLRAEPRRAHVPECPSPRTGGRAVPLPALAAALAIAFCGTVLGYRVGLDHGRPSDVSERPAQAADGADPAATARHTVLASPLLPDAAREVLRDAGIDVREEPVVYVVDGRDGGRWAVPETQLHVRLIDGERRSP